jgi:hypothetical protein
VAYGLIGLSCALTVLIFVMVYADTTKLFPRGDPEGRVQARRVMFWLFTFSPVGFYLLARLRREARFKEPDVPAE